MPYRRASDWTEEWRGRTIGGRFLALILRSDTTPTRFMLAIAATLWAIGLAAPGDTMARPVYRYMAQIAPEWAWGVMWASYAAAMFWRVFTLHTARWCPLAINLFGLALWGYTSISILFTLTNPYPAGTAPDFACLGAAFWVFVRTHLFPYGGWRAD